MTYEDRAPGPENAGIKRGKLTGPDYPHIPNKSERKLLAKMMQASGLTEEQVRQNKVNRVKLAEAAKQPEQRTGNRKKVIRKRMCKMIANKLNLVPYDAVVVSIVREGMNKTPFLYETMEHKIRNSVLDVYSSRGYK